MAEENEPGSPKSEADAMALVEEAEAEAAEADALAAAARARARAARLRREALALAENGVRGTPETEATAQTAEHAGAHAVPDEIAETVDAVALEAAPKPAARRGRLRVPSLVARAAAIVLILCFAGASGYMVWKHREATRQQQRVAALVAGARQGVINLTSLDFNHAQEDVQRVLDSSTGEFRNEFQQRAADFTTVVQQSKAVTEGTVNGAAVESLDEHSAKVLVSATSRVTNKAGAPDQPRTWRLRVTMADDGGKYKMSKVEFVP
jgi:Mce-associated membrane protein